MRWLRSIQAVVLAVAILSSGLIGGCLDVDVQGDGDSLEKMARDWDNEYSRPPERLNPHFESLPDFPDRDQADKTGR